jgi:prepilin-type N-terminal cleavage/methylation domain-containing protein
MKKRGAFTLIELLVVIAVIALLIPALPGSRINASSSRCGFSSVASAYPSPGCAASA